MKLIIFPLLTLLFILLIPNVSQSFSRMKETTGVVQKVASLSNGIGINVSTKDGLTILGESKDSKECDWLTPRTKVVVVYSALRVIFSNETKSCSCSIISIE